jgi:hypothetical protein
MLRFITQTTSQRPNDRLRLASPALLALTLFLAMIQPAAARPIDGPVILVLLPYATVDDWTDPAAMPVLRGLTRTGALALMNTRSAYTPGAKDQEGAEAAALTIGCGARAADHGAATQVVPTGEGQPAVLPHWAEVIRENTGRGYVIHPGNLGDALRAASVSVMAGGGPLSTAVAAASDGTVVRATDDALDNVDGATFLVWDAGDDARVADAYVGRAAATVIRHGGQVIAVSLARGAASKKDEARLTPLLIWGPDVRPGLVYSSSTRRAGIVTNTDLAPTIAAMFKAKLPATAFGRSLTVSPSAKADDEIKAIAKAAREQRRTMGLLPYVALGLGAFIVVGTILALKRRMPPTLAAAPALVCLCLLAAPAPAVLSLTLIVAAVCLSLWSIPALQGTIFGVLVPAAIAAIFTAKIAQQFPWRHLTWPYLAVAALAPYVYGFAIQKAQRHALAAVQTFSATIAAFLLYQLVTGSHYMTVSVLGYSPYEGARYFGMGNEAMGALIGALLAMSGTILNSPHARWRKAFYGMLLATVVLLGLPDAGAKAGGVLVAGAAFGTLIVVREGRGRPWRGIVLSALAAGAALALFAIVDSLRPAAQQTHIGATVHRIIAGGAGEGWDVVVRKARVELRLLTHSTWSALLWASVIGMYVMAHRMTERTPGDRALIFAGAVAIAACLLANDAGVVAAALCAMQLWGALCARHSGIIEPYRGGRDGIGGSEDDRAPRIEAPAAGPATES